MHKKSSDTPKKPQESLEYQQKKQKSFNRQEQSHKNP